MKILSDKEIGKIQIPCYITDGEVEGCIYEDMDCIFCNQQKVAEAQAKLTAKEIFENIESNWGWLSGKKHNSLDAIMSIKYETWLELKQKFGVE